MKYSIEREKNHYVIVDENGKVVSREDTYKEAMEEIKRLQGED